MFADQTVELLPERTTMLTINVNPQINVANVTQTSVALALGGGRNSRTTAIAANFAAVLQSNRS